MTEKYEKVLKIYMPDGAELMYDSKNYDWGEFTVGSIMDLRVFTKDGKEIHTIKGYFAIKQIARKVEEEEKNEA